MDLFWLQRAHAINKTSKNKKQSIPFLDNLALYSTLVFASVLFCSIPFWFTYLKLFFLVFLPKITSFILSSNFLFILGNLIIIALVGKSKFFAPNPPPPASNVYYEEYMSQKRGIQKSVTAVIEEKRKINKIGESCLKENSSKNCAVAKKGRDEDLGYGGDGDQGNLASTDELNKRADDFIARVNKQMRLEARHMLCYSN